MRRPEWVYIKELACRLGEPYLHWSWICHPTWLAPPPNDRGEMRLAGMLCVWASAILKGECPIPYRLQFILAEEEKAKGDPEPAADTAGESETDFYDTYTLKPPEPRPTGQEPFVRWRVSEVTLAKPRPDSEFLGRSPQAPYEYEMSLTDVLAQRRTPAVQSSRSLLRKDEPEPGAEVRPHRPYRPGLARRLSTWAPLIAYVILQNERDTALDPPQGDYAVIPPYDRYGQPAAPEQRFFHLFTHGGPGRSVRSGPAMFCRWPMAGRAGTADKPAPRPDRRRLPLLSHPARPPPFSARWRRAGTRTAGSLEALSSGPCPFRVTEAPRRDLPYVAAGFFAGPRISGLRVSPCRNLFFDNRIVHNRHSGNGGKAADGGLQAVR